MADLIAVSVEIPPASVDEIADALTEQGVFFSTWEDREGGPSRIETYIPGDPESPDWQPYAGMLCESPDAAASLLRSACAEHGIVSEPRQIEIRRENWAESWKRYFKTLRISERLVVRPPWEEYTATQGERVLTLDPGMSFGTGKHATTQACLMLLDELAAGDASQTVLDIGCGSGILSIAAALLGFAGVRGIDNDADAVRIAGENAEANGVSIEYTVCDLSKCKLKARIVVANVLATVLEQYADPVAASVERGDGNALILSGILDSQYAGVKAAYEARGAVETKNILIGEWRTGLFKF